MPDTEISNLPELSAADLQATDPLAIADLSASETKKITVSTLFTTGSNLVPDGSIDPGKIDWDTALPSQIDGNALKDRSVAAIKIVGNSLTAAEIAPNAIGSGELQDGACDTAAIQDSAVIASKIAADQINDVHISPAGLGTSSITNGAITRVKMTLNDNDINGSVIADNSLTAAELAPNAVGSSELADGSVDQNALQNLSVSSEKIQTDAIKNIHLSNSIVGTAELINASVTNSKLSSNSVATNNVQDGSINASKLTSNLPGTILAPESLVTSNLDDACVTEAKLADQSVTSQKIQPGSVSDSKISGLNGGKIQSNSIPALAFQEDAFSNGIELDGTVQLSNEVVPGSQAGIEWNSNGLIVGSSPLPPLDLPVATTTTIGAVSVPPSSGLTVSPAGALDHANKITAGSVSGISYDVNGNITFTRALVGNDLPNATNTVKGACSFPTANNNPILVNGNAEVTHSLSGISPGTYVSLAVNQYGLVDGGSEVLNANQVPGLDASKITTGQFSTNRLADKAVTLPKMADYSVSFIQEAQPQLTADLHIGCRWYQPSTAQERIYDGNVWAAIGFGRLSQENLRWGGVIDADTGYLVALTDVGRTAGLTIGAPLPTATDALGGLYVVVSVGGDNIGVTPGVTYDPGDWCLAINQAEGWIRIDTLSGGGGGGGGAINLGDLLDVDLNNVQPGDTLIYDATISQWTNRTTTADRVTLQPAFDGNETTFTLSMEIYDQNNVLMSIGGVILEPSVDFTIVSGSRQIDFVTPPPAGSTYFLINQQTINTSSGGGGGGGDLPPGTSANELLQWNNSLGSWGPTSQIDGGSF